MDKRIVCYFSVTGSTRSIAKKISEIANADLFEIVPKERYSTLDIDYDNPRSRSSIENLNFDYDVEIESKVENFDEYKYVFLGFPIWWLREPNIIHTFLKQYDFKDKVIIPFCTSSSSGFGNSNKNIEDIAHPKDILKGKRISTYESEESLIWWVNQSLTEEIK